MLTFEWAEIEQVQDEVALPVRIKTVPHKPWMAKRFPILKPLISIAMEMI